MAAAITIVGVFTLFIIGGIISLIHVFKEPNK